MSPDGRPSAAPVLDPGGSIGRGAKSLAEKATAPERVIASTVPALVEELLAARPGEVYRGAVAVLERPLLAHVLAATGGNQLRAARLLGLNRNTLRKRCRDLGLDLPRSSRPVSR